MKQQLISLFFCGVLLLQGCTEKKNEAQLEKTLSVYQVDLKSESPKESIDRFLAGMRTGAKEKLLLQILRTGTWRLVL